MLKNKYTVNFVENADNFWVSTKGISRKMNSFFKNNCESKLKNESKNMKLKLKKSFPEKDNILSYDSDISINEEKKFVSFKKQNKRKSKLQSNKTKLPSYFLNKDLLSMNSQKTEKDKDFWTKKITKDVKIKNKKCFTFLESKNTSQKMSFREINDKNKRNVGNESDFGNGIDPLDEYNINDSKSVTTKSFRMSYKINYSENKISDLINLKHSANSAEIKSDEDFQMTTSLKEQKKNSNEGIILLKKNRKTKNEQKNEDLSVCKDKSNFQLIEYGKAKQSQSNKSSIASSNNINKNKSQRRRTNLRKKTDKDLLNSNNPSFRSEEYSSFSNREKSVRLIEKKINKKILIADDNVILLNMLKKMLNDLFKKYNMDFEIIAVNDGLDILNNVIEDQFNGNLIQCIITDENMEFIKGSDAVKILKDLNQKNRIKDIPVIFLTSYDEIFNFGFSADVNNYKILSKPINYISLEAVMFEFDIIKDVIVDA